MRLQTPVDAGSAHFSGNSRQIESAIDQLDLVEACGAGNGQRVFDTGWIVVRTPIPVVVVIRILGPNGQVILSGINLDLGFVQPLFGVRVLYSIDLHFIAVPTGAVHRAIDVLEFNAAVGGDGISLVKLLRERATVIGRMCANSEG